MGTQASPDRRRATAAATLCSAVPAAPVRILPWLQQGSILRSTPGLFSPAAAAVPPPPAQNPKNRRVAVVQGVGGHSSRSRVQAGRMLRLHRGVSAVVVFVCQGAQLCCSAFLFKSVFVFRQQRNNVARYYN